MYITDETKDYDMRQWVNHNYGDGWKAMWTMFLVTFSGGWPQWCDPLVQKVHVGWAIFFAAYITFVVFAIFRIITALFLQDAMHATTARVEVSLEGGWGSVIVSRGLLSLVCCLGPENINVLALTLVHPPGPR